MPKLGYRRPLIIGRDLAVFFQRLRRTSWPEVSQPDGQIVVFFVPALSELTWFLKKNGKPRVKRIKGRQVCFIAPNVRHVATWENEADLLVIYLRPAFLRQQLGSRMWTGVVVGEFAALAGKDPSLWLFLHLCRRLCDGDNEIDHPLIERLGHGLALRLLQSRFGSGNGTSVPVFSEDDLERLTDYIEANFQRVPKVDELASLVGLGPEQFSRLFKNTTGDTPAHYRDVCRMQKASEMLASGKYRLKEISEALGFRSDVSYFSRWFKRHFDVRPTAYLRKLRKLVTTE